MDILREIDKLDAEQCSRGWRYESCHHFRLENSIYFSGREIVGNVQRNVLMLSLTFNDNNTQQPLATTTTATAAPTTTTKTQQKQQQKQQQQQQQQQLHVSSLVLRWVR